MKFLSLSKMQSRCKTAMHLMPLILLMPLLWAMQAAFPSRKVHHTLADYMHTASYDRHMDEPDAEGTCA